ncbi:MAG: glutamine-hydrolyzing carbamoyl-phosphate synthase small subunit [Clostridia bacterium]
MGKAVLVLEDGTFFSGENFGSGGEAFGEVVFNTSMTGYQEITTDPSYKGQMVCMTYPLIGNYGMNDIDTESYKTHVEGFIVKELCEFHSNFRASISPEQYFSDNHIIGIKGIDTRALTQHIRKKGSMMGVISTRCGNIDLLLKKIEDHHIGKRNLVGEVSLATPMHIKGNGKRVAVLDLGVKYSILRSLEKRDCEIFVFPYDTPFETIMESHPAGIILSNGPGDPRALESLLPKTRKIIESGLPVLGICLGHQLLALAMGMEIFKLKFGHHGGNHAVKDIHAGKCYITCQNHNYAVSFEHVSPDVEITHVNINDHTVEGFFHRKNPVMSVQYHPEASPGSLDSGYIFDDFISLMQKG